MKIPAINLLVSLLFFVPSIVYAQTFTPDSLMIYRVRPGQTDASIYFWNTDSHYVFINRTAFPLNKLLVHFVGTYDKPASTLYFPSLAANNGYHAISIVYPNDKSGQQFCSASTDTNCYENFNREAVEGADYSPDIVVGPPNSILNRILKLLIYLDTNHPNDGWSQYYSGTSINWNLVVLSGHSQGGSKAAFLAMERKVDRVILFATPNEFIDTLQTIAAWLKKPHLTPDSSYYGFAHLKDVIGGIKEQLLCWNALGMPAFGDPVFVDEVQSPYNYSHQLYTNLGGAVGAHSRPVIDGQVPLDSSGIPVYESVWRYLLGLPLITGNDLYQPSAALPGIGIYPNPVQQGGVITVRHAAPGVTEIAIADATGRMVYCKKNILAGSPEEIIEKKFLTGVYFVRISGTSFSAVVKLVIQ